MFEKGWLTIFSPLFALGRLVLGEGVPYRVREHGQKEWLREPLRWCAYVSNTQQGRSSVQSKVAVHQCCLSVRRKGLFSLCMDALWLRLWPYYLTWSCGSSPSSMFRCLVRCFFRFVHSGVWIFPSTPVVAHTNKLSDSG